MGVTGQKYESLGRKPHSLGFALRCYASRTTDYRLQSGGSR